MRITLKNKAKLTLSKLLKRRKMSLKQFILEQGISTYDLLKERCKHLGIIEPSKEEYLKVIPEQITDQSEGIIVLNPPTNTEGELTHIQTEIESLDINQQTAKKKKYKKTY